jgi:hypothetical protein
MAYILGIDVWEGNPNLDETYLLTEEVKYMVVRLNSMSGGHHMDENFPQQWEQAANFIRWPYFVYNPWVTGQGNFDWLAAHMPPDAHAVSADIEVIKEDYSPHEYANQVEIFRAQVARHWNYNIYTGLWFEACLDHWPADCQYWWGRYPFALHPTERQAITWEQLRSKMDAYGWHPGETFGPCVHWQCTADRYILPGCGNTCVDINEYHGTLDELAAWAGQPTPPPQTWAQEIDAWARTQGYTGPEPA